ANTFSHWADEEHDAEIPEDALRDISVEEAVHRLSQTIRGRIHADKLREAITNRIENVASAVMEKHIRPQDVERSELWDTASITEDFSRAFASEIDPNDFPNGEGGESQYGALRDHLVEVGTKLYEEREKKICSDPEGNLMKTPGGKPAYGRMRQVEQWLLLQSIDENWKQHLRNLDVLKGSIHWEGYAQKDPKDAYKKKGAAIFETMLDEIDVEVISTLFRIDIKEDDTPRPPQTKVMSAAKPAVQSSGTSGMEATKEQKATRREMDRAATPNAPKAGYQKKKKLPGPNEPCWCGSGKKYKKCHMAEDKASV
ncbi:MAG: SEC-C metal-binding domain-containing protein, partial [Planctomycetota bacterium]